jgi:hypothetical protein
VSNGQIDHHGPLQAVLFHVAFWRLNLAYSTDTRSILGPGAKWVSSCGRFRHRHTIGYRERH